MRAKNCFQCGIFFDFIVSEKLYKNGKVCYTGGMKLDTRQLAFLGLSRKEMSVFAAICDGENTPVRISKRTKVSRPAVYEILMRLHTRGLVQSRIKEGKKQWSRAKEQDLERALYATKRALFAIPEGAEELFGRSDSTVIVHRGGKAIRALIRRMFRDNRDCRFHGIQGDRVNIGWNKVFGVEATNELNRWIKSNRIIMEGIFPPQFFERVSAENGISWARDFEGRMAVMNEIDEKYFQHGGQIFMFKKSLYLMAMNEEIIIEVRHSEIQKLLLAMFTFIQDHSRKFDVNARLREIMAKKE